MESQLERPVPRVVLYEGAGSRPLAGGERADVMLRMLERGLAVTATAGTGAVAPDDGAPVILTGCFDAHAVPDAPGALGTIPLDPANPDLMVDGVAALTADAPVRQEGEWTPWFPVIDFDRCTNCMQCLSFCLFGVYGVSSESQIEVQNSDKCKTNCPACSRVCPEAAIMFPKYSAGPVNGDEVTDDSVARESMKVDISALLGGDVYSALRSRSEQARERFAKERDEQVALKERRRCLAELQKDLDIPPEVLMSLPSPDEIRQRAEAARQAGAAALRQSEESVARRLRDRDAGMEN